MIDKSLLLMQIGKFVCFLLLTVGRVWQALWPAANPGALPERFGCSKPAVGGDERVEIKEIFENDGLWNGKKCKMVMLQSGFFGHLWKWYALERKFKAENGGLSRTYPICIHIWKYPPPPPPRHRYENRMLPWKRCDDMNQKEVGRSGWEERDRENEISRGRWKG